MAPFVDLKPRQNINFTKRLSYFLYFCYITVFIILFRFFQLQIINGDYYSLLSSGNTEQKYPLIPPRGLIFDRNGIIMAKNRASYNLSIIPAYLPKKKKLREKVLKKISKDFNIPIKYLKNKIRKKLRHYTPIIIQENLLKKNILYLEENRQNFPFLSIIEYSARIYPFGESASHILGYIGMVSQQELEKNKNYRLDSIVGKTGLEKYYDHNLRGVEGENTKIVNSIGKPLRNLPEKYIPPTPGKNVVLSIDSNLQEFAYNLLYGKRGVIIVIKVLTGEVLSLVSSPGFDANLFVNPKAREKIFYKLKKNPDEPFLNRAIQGKYPPGSIFKVVTAIAGIEDGKVSTDEKIKCKGYFELGDRVFKDWKIHSGPINIYSAIEHSCNIYFYTLGYRLGYASILEYANNIGLNNITNIDIPGEISSRIPTPEWKELNYKEPWYDGDTVNASIGQGFISLTPIGANNIITIIANGRINQPRILWAIKNPYTGIIEKEFSPKLLSQFQLGDKTLEIIREGLRRVPITGTGTYHKWLSKIPIAGKTGSAQNIKKKTHSWFISYGPLDKPLKEQYTVTVMVETAGHGGTIAVPIASMIYNFLEGKMDREKALKIIDQIFKYQEQR